MKSILSIYIISILLISGCKDESTQPLDLQNKKLLHKTYSVLNSNTYTEYFYTDFHKIAKIESYNNGNLERNSEYEYNEKQNLVKVSTFITFSGIPEYSYDLYEYNTDGTLSKMLAFLKISDGTYEFRSTTKYEYDVNKRLTKSSIFTSDSVEVKYTLFIYDDKNNIIETNFYQNGSLSFNDKYEYDNMNNPLKEITSYNSVFDLSHNNITKNSQINYMMGNVQSAIIYSYQYNQFGYPISCNYDSQIYYYDYY